MNNETFYTPEQIAEKLQLSLTTVYQLIKSRQIPAIRLGKSFRIAESELTQSWWGREKEICPATALYFVDQLKKAPFSEKIEDVILFGSWARGTAAPFSDIDLLLIHNNLAPAEKNIVLRMETDAMEMTEFRDELSVLKKTRHQWDFLANIQAALYRNVTDEGRSLWKNKTNRNFSDKER